MTLCSKTAFIAAALLGCISCVKIDDSVGGNMVPVSHTYRVVSPDAFPMNVKMLIADSLSGFSSTRITVGAVRKDSELGLTTRSSCVSLVPMHREMDWGTNPELKQFHFTASPDTVSVADKSQGSILQSVLVYELSQRVNTDKSFSCTDDVPHGTTRVTAGIPVINGTDSLAFDFSPAFAAKYMGITSDDLKNFDTYLEKYPGIYITTDAPVGDGGRINIFSLQTGYTDGYLTGSFAELKFRSTWTENGVSVRKDSSFFFWFSPTRKPNSASGWYDIDSLLNASGTGSFPQYCLNLTGHDQALSVARAGDAADYIYVEGGGGLKPVISGKFLRDTVRAIIAAGGDDPSKAIINRATLILPFEPSDPDFELMYKVPDILSPTCRLRNDTTVTFLGLTDSSDQYEDQGNINRSRLIYSPDITYHVQELLKMEDGNARLQDGSYDIWLLIMHNETTTTTTGGNQDMSEYYNYLAYQSYMNSMYSGYGGYGGYGYGDYYTNYYNYAMMAQYYSSSSTSVSTSSQLDRDRYYYARLCGPSYPDASRRPKFKFSYSVPNK